MIHRRQWLLGALAQAAPAPRPWFSDATAHVFGAVPSFRDQLAKGIPYWRARLDAMCGTDVYGSQGIAVGDIDNDGRDEIYVCQSGGLPNRLYRIGDDLRAVDVTEASGTGILDDTSSALFLDTRNRGLQDLIVLRSSGPLLFENQGHGRFLLREEAFRFARAPQGSFTGMAAADYDGDGLVDLYLCCYIYYQSEDQYRYPRPYHDARNGPPNFLFRNRGGIFEDVTAASGIDENNDRFSFAAAWCDCDNDGRPELYVANDFGRNNLYQFDGRRFHDIAARAGVEDIGPGMSAAWFDFDNDGRFDLYVANMYSGPGQHIVRERRLEPAEAYRRHAKGNTLYRNRGDGTFEETRQAEMGRWAWSADACDFDGDGRPEIYIATGMITGHKPADNHEYFWDQVVAQQGKPYEEGWNTINRRIREGESWCGHEPNVFYVLSGGRYVDQSAESGIAFADDSRAFAFTDFDQDGAIDVVLKSRLGPQIRMLRNERGGGKPVVALRLTGTRSNRDAIGAVVRLGQQTRQVTAGSGYLSQHSKTLHFAAQATTAEICWPSGQVERVADLRPGFRHDITEGAATVKRTPFRAHTALSTGTLPVDNHPAHVSFRLLEPLPFPEAVREPQARVTLGRFLRDWRQPLPENARFQRNARGDLIAIEIPGTALVPPFPGEYISPPARNVVKIGAAFYQERLPDAAAAYLEAALRERPNADAANGLGLMFAKQQRYDQARDWFLKALAADPNHYGAANNLGVLYGEQKRFAEAIATFEAGIAAQPTNETLYLNLARIHIQSGSRDKARQVLLRLLEQKPDSSVARRGLEELEKR